MSHSLARSPRYRVRDEDIEAGRRSIIEIDSLTDEDFTEYTCFVENSYGKDHLTIRYSRRGRLSNIVMRMHFKILNIFHLTSLSYFDFIECTYSYIRLYVRMFILTFVMNACMYVCNMNVCIFLLVRRYI